MGRITLASPGDDEMECSKDGFRGSRIFHMGLVDVWPFDPTCQRQKIGEEQAARLRCLECHHDFGSPQRDCRTCRAGLGGGRRAPKLDTTGSHKRPRKEEGQAPPSQPASSSWEDPLNRRQQNRQGKGEGETPAPLRRRRNSRDGRPAHRQDRDQSDQTSDDENVRTAPEVVDSALIDPASRCKGETYLRPTFGRELNRYMACQLRLFNMGHYFPYGPWPLDFDGWSDFEKVTMKEIEGTAAFGVTLHPKYSDRGDVGITFNADKWNMRAVRAGDKVVISNSHTALDHIFDPKVTSARRGVITLEWKSSWTRLEEYLPEHRPLSVQSVRPVASGLTHTLKTSAQEGYACS